MIEVISQAEEYLQTTAGVDITSSASNAGTRTGSQFDIEPSEIKERPIRSG